MNTNTYIATMEYFNLVARPFWALIVFSIAYFTFKRVLSNQTHLKYHKKRLLVIATNNKMLSRWILSAIPTRSVIMVRLSPRQKGNYILWINETQSPIRVRRKFHIHFSINNGRDLPSERAIKFLYSMFLETGYFSSRTKKRGRKRAVHMLNYTNFWYKWNKIAL